MSYTLDKVTQTQRGFEYISFEDCYGEPCSLQQSSMARSEQPGASAVWLGIQDYRMHLDIGQVESLVKRLQSWLDTGSFGADSE